MLMFNLQNKSPYFRYLLGNYKYNLEKDLRNLSSYGADTIYKK